MTTPGNKALTLAKRSHTVAHHNNLARGHEPNATHSTKQLTQLSPDLLLHHTAETPSQNAADTRHVQHIHIHAGKSYKM